MRMRAWPSLVLVLVRCSADLDVLWRWGTQNGADLERVRASDTLAHGRGLVWRCSEQVPPPSCLEFREGDALFHLPARLAMSSRVLRPQLTSQRTEASNHAWVASAQYSEAFEPI